MRGLLFCSPDSVADDEPKALGINPGPGGRRLGAVFETRDRDAKLIKFSITRALCPKMDRDSAGSA